MSPGRCSSLDLLDPQFAARVHDLVTRANANGLPLDIFETARGPERQLALWQIGRGDPHAPGYGRTVTDAQPYQSAHQFGLGTDLVFRVNGQWTWKEPQPGMWDHYRALANAPGTGLTTLFDKHGKPLEEPHVQVRGFDWRALAPGPADDGSWYGWLRQRVTGIG